MANHYGRFSGDWADWKPTYLPNNKCKFWVDGKDASSFLLSGSKVDTWQDKSIYGNDFIQPVAGLQPTWNGNQVIFGSSPSSSLYCDMNFSNLSEWEYYRVSRRTSGNHYYPLYNNNNPKRLWDYHAGATPDQIRFYLNTQYCTPYPTGTNFTNEVKGISQTVINDDENFTVMKGYRANYTGLPSDKVLYLDDRTYMNGRSGTNFDDMDLFELIITAKLTQKERSAMLEYLQTRHNV